MLSHKNKPIMAASKPRFPVLKSRPVMAVEEMAKIISSVKDDPAETAEISEAPEPALSLPGPVVLAGEEETAVLLAEESGSDKIATDKPSFDSFMHRLTDFEGDKYFSSVIYEPIKNELQKIALEQKTTVAALSNTILYKWLLMYKPDIISSRKQLSKKKSII